MDDRTQSLIYSAVDKGYSSMLEKADTIAPSAPSPTKLDYALPSYMSLSRETSAQSSEANALVRYTAPEPDVRANDPIVIQKTLLPSGPVTSANAIQHDVIAHGGPTARGEPQEYLTYDESLSWGEVAMYFGVGLAAAYVIDRYV